MKTYYKGAGYVFENMIEVALRNNFPQLTILNESQIQRIFGSYQGLNRKVNGVDLLCSDGIKFLAIQSKLVSSQPKTSSIEDFINTSLMIEQKIQKPLTKMFVTTFMPYFPGIQMCKNNNVQIIYHQYQNILIENLISILKDGKPIHSLDVDIDGDIPM